MKRSTRILCLIIAAVMLCGVLFALLGAAAWAAAPEEKSETVYVTADATGKPVSVLSSVYITNPEKRDTLLDTTTLSEIKNVGSSETPEQQADGSYLFKTDGDGLSYQGRAEASGLPIAMRVSYTLDGRPIAAERLAGQSGRVGITIRYENRHTQQAEVDGETLTLYTPFTVITMLTLDDAFSNITVENTKVMAEAGVNTVTGVTFPGLAANIEAEPEGRLAESFTVEADVTGFELDGITAIAMTGIVDADDVSDLDDMRELTDGVDEMSDAGDDLYDGTRKLYDGAQEFAEGLEEYLDGVDALYDGAMEATDGAGELYDGADELADGAQALYEGVDELYEALANSLSQMGSGSGAAAPTQQEIADLAQEIYGIAAANIAQGAGDPAAAASAVGSIASKLGALAQQAGAAGAAQAAQAMATQMNDLLAGVKELRSGAKELAAGARELAKGVKELRSGMVDMEEGLRELSENGAELRTGAYDIADGLRKLKKGVKELNEEGLKELASNTSDMQILLERKDAMVALGEQYQSFSGKPEQMKGTVKLVFETASIFMEKPLETPAPEAAPEAVPPAGEQGFFARIWSWLKNLFGAA